MNNYQHLFFDLDHTLWDYEANAAEVLDELYHRHTLRKVINSESNHFTEVFFEINNSLWDQYDRGLIHKSVIRNERFDRILAAFGVSDSPLAKTINSAFIAECPHKTNVVPGAVELLAHLKPKFGIHIITNGFREVQWIKITKSGLDRFIDQVFISEEIGAKKPDPKFFEFSLGKVDCTPAQSVVIGDNLNTDIKGARDFGIDHIFYNPKKLIHNDRVTWEINHLSQVAELI